MTLKIEERAEEDIVIVALHGYVDANTAPELYRRLEDLRRKGSARIIVDVANVTYMSSHGVWTLVKHAILTREDGGDVRVAQPTRPVQTVLHELNLETFLQIFERLDQATLSFRSAD